MSAINVNSITGRTGTHGPVLTGVTTVTGGTLNTAALNVTGAASFSGNVSIAGTLSYEDVTDIDSVGLITARSGVSITGGDLTLPDAIVHSGDTNTKIRFPAADTITAETGGSERVRINNHGLSIKNSTNTSALCVNNVRGTASAPSFNEANSDGFLVDVYNTGNPYPRYVSLAARGYDTTTADMSFWTDNGSSVLERLRITSAGKLEAYKGTSTTGKTSGSEAFTVGNGASNHRFAVYPDGTTVIGGTGDIGNNNIQLTNNGNATFAGTIISQANPEASDTTNGAMLDKVKVVVRNAAGQSVWLGYKNGTSGATSSINVDGDTTIRDLTVRTVTSSDQVISNRSGTSVCFRAQDSGTDKFVVQADGKVGIGTDNPTNTLHVYKAGDGQTPVFFQTGNSTGKLRFYNDSDGWSLDSDGDLRFVSGRTNSGTPTRMRINSNGTVDIDVAGTYQGKQTNAHYTNNNIHNQWIHYIQHTGTSPYGITIRYKGTNVAPNGLVNDFIHCEDYITNRFSVRSNGDCDSATGSYGSYSDIKLKENIVDAPSQWSDLKNIRVRNFNFTEESGLNNGKFLGVIAQEVELVSAGLVSDVPDRDEDNNPIGTTTKSVKYSILYMKSIKALQEAMERIETLEAKVAALEGS